MWRPLFRLPEVDDMVPVVDRRVWHTRGAFSLFLAVLVIVGATVVTGTFEPAVLTAGIASLLVPFLLAWAGRGWWERQWTLLLWPVAVNLSLVAVSLSASDATTLLAGVIILSFLWVGLTQPRGTGLLLVPFGVVVLLVSSDLTPHEAAVRLPIAVLMWTLVSEVPARLLDELRTRELALRRAATTDPLTGLLNRSDLDLHLGALNGSSAVLLVDLDHFKRYNDEHGHVQGDAALRAFAGVLAENRRSGDLVYRFGGEEFLVILPLATPDDAVLVAQRMADALAATDVGLTFSGGIARAGRGAVERADAALYRAKREGRARVLLAEDEPLAASDG